MLKYLVDSTLQLLAMMLAAGAIFGYIKVNYKEKKRKWMRIFLCLGIVLAVLMAVLRTSTNLIDNGMWNLWFYEVSAALTLIFLIFAWIKKCPGKVISFICLGIILLIQLVYSLSDFFIYPHTMMLTEESMLSTAFLTKMSGMLLGFLLVLIIGLAVNGVSSRLAGSGAYFLLGVLLLIQSFKQVTASFSTLLARRMVANNHTMFQLAKFSSNQSNFFIYISMIAAAIAAVILLLRSFTVKIEAENSALMRKAKHKWLLARRWSIAYLAGCIAAVLVMTLIYSLANQEIELSPVEETTISDTAMYISFEQVSDGHLHRFGYTTPDGTVIRVIVIQKPNSSSYGIGLDACDICGETGYYEKNGQVVCNLCDVVMNINTIGFKGGCNPIVIDYSIENGNIVIPLEGLLENESVFK